MFHGLHSSLERRRRRDVSLMVEALSLTALLGPVGGHEHAESFPEVEVTEIILA
jgi:hypothetical protein